MIIKHDNEHYIVICMYWNENSEKKNWLYCWNLDKKFIEGINFYDAEIIDGKMPSNMHLKRNKEESENGDIIGWSWDLENYEIFKNSDWFWDALCENEAKANLLLHSIINEIKAFHNLPLEDLSELEEAAKEEDNYKVSEGERRQKELNDELDEYLRIGEEIEKTREKERAE